MNDSGSIDLKYYFELFLSKWKWIFLSAVVLAVVAYLYSSFFITPEYMADTSVYVNNKKTINTATDVAKKEDITTSESLVPTYMSIVKSRTAIQKVLEESRLKYSIGQVKSMITTTAEEETGIFRIYVRNTNPKDAVLLANTIAKVAASETSNYVEGTSASVIDYAVEPTAPVSPNVMKNTAIGFMGGILLSVLLICLMDLLDISIKSESDITSAIPYPVLGTIPDLGMADTAGGYYAYSERKGGRPK